MFGNNRDSLRRYYCTVWGKANAGQALEPLERLIARIINEHPEYQPMLVDAEAALSRDYLPEMGQTNPFLHLGMHLALEEQRSIDQPPGIRALYARLAAHATDEHQAQHQCIDALAETIWQAQRQGCPPDGDSYLQALRRLAGDTGTK